MKQPVAPDIQPERIAVMLSELEDVARQIRLGLNGVRLGLPLECQQSQELKSMMSRVWDFEIALGRTRAGIAGRKFKLPRDVEERDLSPPRGTLNS
jgi:hypothetical protein